MKPSSFQACDLCRLGDKCVRCPVSALLTCPSSRPTVLQPWLLPGPLALCAPCGPPRGPPLHTARSRRPASGASDGPAARRPISVPPSSTDTKQCEHGQATHLPSLLWAPPVLSVSGWGRSYCREGHFSCWTVTSLVSKVPFKQTLPPSSHPQGHLLKAKKGSGLLTPAGKRAPCTSAILRRSQHLSLCSLGPTGSP